MERLRARRLQTQVPPTMPPTSTDASASLELEEQLEALNEEALIASLRRQKVMGWPLPASHFIFAEPGPIGIGWAEDADGSLIVKDVDEGSPAQRQGVPVDGVLYEVDGRRVEAMGVAMATVTITHRKRGPPKVCDRIAGVRRGGVGLVVYGS